MSAVAKIGSQSVGYDQAKHFDTKVRSVVDDAKRQQARQMLQAVIEQGELDDEILSVLTQASNGNLLDITA